MNQQLLADWYPLLKDEVEKEYFKNLREELKREYTTTKCFPDPQDIFKVFQLCPLEKVRVVILSQDPYPSPHAHGIAFSSQRSDTPFSLQMILREVDRDVVKTKNYKEFKEAFPNNDLTPWVKQGVFLLNVNLTVRAGQPMSHNHLGWREFTKTVLQLIWKDSQTKVFVLLGREAREGLYSAISEFSPSAIQPRAIIEGGHPASGAHGKDKFSGVGFPSKINRYFKLKGLPEINWKLNAV